MSFCLLCFLFFLCLFHFSFSLRIVCCLFLYMFILSFIFSFCGKSKNPTIKFFFCKIVDILVWAATFGHFKRTLLERPWTLFKSRASKKNIYLRRSSDAKNFAPIIASVVWFASRTRALQSWLASILGRSHLSASLYQKHHFHRVESRHQKKTFSRDQFRLYESQKDQRAKIVIRPIPNRTVQGLYARIDVYLNSYQYLHVAIIIKLEYPEKRSEWKSFKREKLVKYFFSSVQTEKNVFIECSNVLESYLWEILNM